MLRASQAIRMGLRAATRNPELPFAKALLDLSGTVLSALPVLFCGLLLWNAIAGQPILRGLLFAVHALQRLAWPIAGALFAGAAISWAVAAGFFAGALPLVAADVEMNERPSPKLFFPLAFNGFARVAGASAIATLLSLLVGFSLLAATLIGVPLFLFDPSPGLGLGLAAILTCAIGTGFFVDLLGNLALVRAAVLGDGPALAFVRGARLLGDRLGAAVLVSFVFFVMQLVASTALYGLLGPALSDDLSPGAQLLAMGPRIALSIASAAVFAWLELSQKAALAALAADDEGLLELPPEPEPPPAPRPRLATQVWELRPPKVAAQPERIIEALPVAEEPVIEAVPVPEKKPDEGGGSGGPE